MKRFQLIPLILSGFLISGCALEEVINIDSPCPPKDADDGAKLEYIYLKTCTKGNCTLDDFDEYLERGFCPPAYPLCQKNKEGTDYHCEILKEYFTDCLPPKFTCNDETGAAICVDFKDDEYCGAVDCENLGTNCTLLKNRKCALEEGEFQCLCQENATYCEESDICAMLSNDVNNCGKCGNICGEKQICENGSCRDSDCGFKCNQKVGDVWMCVNRNDACGSDCQNCTTITTEAYCEEGKCVVPQCHYGAHPKYRNGKIVECIENTPTSCGSFDMPENSTPTDCTQNMPNNATSMTCSDDGKCILSGCESGFAIENGICKRVSCGENQYLDGETCKNYITKCGDGQHISSDKKSCVANSASSCAPKTSNQAVDCTKGVAKICNSEGKCACTSDGSKVLNFDGTVCIRKACKGIYGVIASTVDTSSDYCVPTKCASGFVTDYTKGSHWGACRPISNSTSECNKLPGWKTSHIRGGQCWADSCKSGYRVFHATCQPTKNACGDAGHNCEVLGKTCSGTSTSSKCQ